MASSAAQVRGDGRRRWILAFSVGAHALILWAALALRPPTLNMADTDVFAISLSGGVRPSAASHHATVPAARSPADTKPEPPPTDMAPQYVDITLADDRDPLNDPVAVAVAGAAAAGKSCDISIWLQAALQNDARVQAAFAQMPRNSRSVANALMLWDQGWVRAEPAAAPAVGEIAAAVASGVRAAPEACRTATVRGPELITLKAGDETVVVAIGSGQWTWQSLLEPKDALAPAPAATTKGRLFDIFAGRR